MLSIYVFFNDHGTGYKNTHITIRKYGKEAGK